MKNSAEPVAEKTCVQQVITKRKMEFMKECNFADSDVELLVDIKPDAEKYSEYIDKNPVHKSTSCRPQFAEHEVCITKYIYL